MESSSSKELEMEMKLKERLEELKRDLSKKQKFEDAVVALEAILTRHYASASPPIRQLLYSVISRAATVLRTRYTSAGLWVAGLRLFEQAHGLVAEDDQKSHLQSCISLARHFLASSSEPPGRRDREDGYLFEGHLTVDVEPPPPQWLLLNESETESALIIPAAPRVPPASKEAVAKLPIIRVSEETLGQHSECPICKDNLALNHHIQQLPCNHIFHPPCLKPWLDEHNSCPICRHELETDDHNYESWKERQKEAEEERKAAANALRGGEYMYV